MMKERREKMKLKKIISAMLALTIVGQFSFALPVANAAANQGDTSIYLDFEENEVSEKPTTMYTAGSAVAVTDGANNNTGISTYSATGTRWDAYHYISGDESNKYFVYDTIDTSGKEGGWYHSYIDLTNYHGKTDDAVGKSFIYESKVKFVQGNCEFLILDASNTANAGRGSAAIASMSFEEDKITCSS